MFGGKKSLVNEELIETIIGKDTIIQGTINATGGVRIDGQVEGELISAANVFIGETGCVKTQIKAKNAIIAGTVRGAVDVTEKLELLPTAKLYGDMKVGAIIIGEGALFKGACEMRSENVINMPENKKQQA